jgi:pimeloyl-ACP methyl ester carboxylesterase
LGLRRWPNITSGGCPAKTIPWDPGVVGLGMPLRSHERTTAIRRIFKRIVFLAASFLTLACVALLFFSWQSLRRETKSPVEAAPASGHFGTVDNTQIFYQEAGPASGKPILLLHGTGAWSEIWRETMTALAKSGFRAIAMDVPPFGYSGKPDGVFEYTRQKQARRIIGLLEVLHIEHATVVAHSVGARAAVEASLAAPERVDRLVLVDPALGFSSDPDDMPRFEQNHPVWWVRAFFAVKPVRNGLLRTYGTNPLSTKTIFGSFVARKESVTDARVEMLQRPLVVENTTNGYGDWLQELLISQDTSLGNDFANLRKLPMPVFLIWGRADSVTPLWQGQQLKKLIPNWDLAVIDNVGHIPYIEDTDKFNSLLLGYLTNQSFRREASRKFISH